MTTVADPAGRGRARERGSVLLLMPAAVLVVIILGALSVDRALVFGAQRELVNEAQAAANDAAALGIDVDALRAGGAVRYDRDRIDRAVRSSLAGVDGITVRWVIDGDEIVVRLERRVSYVFTKGVPGAADTAVVHATARARLVRTTPG